MVKNKTGGNKAKKQGRKHASVPQNRNTRFAKEDGEMYAVITKIFGGPNCEAMCNDGKTRMCVIRNKFRGRDKKDNTISNNTWVLVGLRDWEVVANGKLEKCDLLEVYRNNEKEKIINTLNKNELIMPTKIYSNEINKLVQKKLINACANITGGGLINNLIRVIPNNFSAEINLNKIKITKIFKWLKKNNIHDNEMLQTFNCGVGFCIIANKKN